MTQVLVIEDDENIRGDLLELLEGEGFVASVADDGLAGVAAARASLPDLILCDIMMPSLDGFGVLDELSQDPVTATIPFIFLTARSDKSDVRRGMELGADDYLTKPVEQAELLRAIETRLAKQAALDKKFQRKLKDLRDTLAFSLPHEFRTPLTGILTSAEILRDHGPLEPSDVNELADIVYRSATRMNRLVMNYLLYAELELAMTDPDKVQALRQSRTDDAKTIVERVALEKAQAAERGGDLKLELKVAAPRIAPSHLEKIIIELLDNTFKYSKAGTPVYVTCGPAPNGFTLSVSDHGRGMTAAQIADVGAYVQFERKVHEQQGSGLGLAIARRLAEVYGGDLTIESTPGQQTTVHVILPA
jgi:two-component system sensor histidine kinase/response regulator